MRHFFLPIILIATFSLSIFAQQHPRGLAGTWILDEESTFDREDDRKVYSDYVMEITEEKETFLIKISYKMDKRDVSYELALFKDGRGEENRLDARISETSETTSTQDKITRKYTRNGPGPRPATGVDEFLLSRDGLKLIRRRTQDTDVSAPPSRFPGMRERLRANTQPTLVFKRRS